MICVQINISSGAHSICRDSMGLSEETVITELHKLLKTVDLAATSEKKVVELLRKELGKDVDEHKAAMQVLRRSTESLT